MTESEKIEARAIGFPVGPFVVVRRKTGSWRGLRTHEVEHMSRHDDLADAAQECELTRDTAFVFDEDSKRIVYRKKPIKEGD